VFGHSGSHAPQLIHSLVIVVAIYVDPGLLLKLGNDQLRTLTTLISAGNRSPGASSICVILEVNQIDILARPMLCHFQKIDNTCEAGSSRQLGRDVSEGYAPDRCYFDEPVP
jgi:hypothetical protein